MRLPELQRILIDGARRQERAAPVSPRRRLGGRRPLILALAVLLVGGSAGAAVITLSRSKPLSGTLAQGPSPRAASRYRISVFPYMTAGWSGWCSSAVFDSHSRREVSDYGCFAVESGGPAVACCGSFGDQRGEYSYGIVSDGVASVHWDGKVVPTIKSPRLPPGTRAFFIVGRARNLSPRLPKLFDSSGQEIPNPLISRENAVEHLPEIAVDPRNPSNRPCAVRASNVPHLVPLSQTVTTPVPWPRRQPGAFLACANAIYKVNGVTLGIAVLVDASNAHRPAPPLPELQPDPGHPGLLAGHELGTIGFPHGMGVFNGGGGRAFNTTTRQQEFANHDISARRFGPAWIIAEGGTPAQRATLLAHLTTGG
ncbi:MAG: hypothetical protein JWN81_62 [Solirubrobacterales bacterium]|nr:hypothetical protein [Solirubrobacterales bacterium]